MRRALALVPFLLLAVAAPAAAAAEYAPDRAIVRFEAGVDARERAQVRANHDVRALEALPIERTQVVALRPGATVTRTIRALERDPRVAYAEPDWVVRASAVPDDPRFPNLWGLHNTGQSILGAPGLADADIDAPEAWDVTTGSEQVTVAVVDTGIAPAHPDLVQQLVPGRDFVDGDDDPLDLDGHGTHVAGTLGARGGDGTGGTGVAQRVQIMPVRVLDGSGSGYTSDVAAGFAWAAANGARIVNASLGGGGASQTLRDAIERAPGTLFVVAAGNAGKDVDLPGNAEYPCSYTAANLLCVAASDSSDARASFSNWGATSVDIAAPGRRIEASYPTFARAFQERFESGLNAWVAEGGWALSSRASEGASSLGSGYPQSSDASARTAAPIDLAGRRGCKLILDAQLALADDADALHVEASASAEGPWTTLWSGSYDTTGFETFSFDLKGPDEAPYDFDGSAFHLRFRFATDGANTRGAPYDGAFVDWIEVTCLSDTPAWTFLSGTSMATPMVSGAAALVAAEYPGSSALDMKARLLGGGDRVTAWDGRTLSGKRLNAAGALRLEAAPAATPVAPGPTSPPPPASAPASTPPVGEPEQTGGDARPPAPAPAVTPDLSPPAGLLAVGRIPRLAVLARRGHVLRAGCDEACSIRADLYLLRAGRRIAIGRARGALAGAGDTRVVARLTRRGRAVLSRTARSARILVLVRRVDANGNAGTVERRLRARR